MSKIYLGVVQLTPLVVLFALVVRLFPSALKAQKNSPGRLGRFSITSCRVLKYIYICTFDYIDVRNHLKK